MQPTEQDIIKAYNIAKETGADSTCKVLETLFPDVDFNPKDNRPVTERIKTFEDACRELGETHPFVETYNVFEHDVRASVGGEFLTDIAAYLKLRIVCAALNEGWEPQFTEDEEGWYPWHCLYTQGELDNMTDDEKQGRSIISTDDYKTDYCGFAYAYSNSAPSNTSAYFGSRLCFKSLELALYAGRQFIDIWANFKLICRR